MGLNNRYTLDFTHPPKEPETIEYRLEDDFFEGIEDALIHGGEVDLRLTITPMPDHVLDLAFSYKGEVEVECDRCLQPLRLPMEVEEGLEIVLGDHFDDENDELIRLDVQDPVYDFTWIIYELLALHLPIQRMHDIEDCDPEMVKYLVDEAPEEDAAIDPRWEALKNKINRNNNN